MNRSVGRVKDNEFQTNMRLLVKLAKAGDESARLMLAKPPYNMKVYTPEEKRQFEEMRYGSH